MKRVMCIYLPAWPLQRLVHDRPELRGQSLALATAHESRPSVLCCSRAAARAGVRPHTPVAEAVAIDPSLVVEEEDPASDVRALERLAAWAERYSPLVGLEEGPAPHCLLLDITGCAGCFRGEENLAQLATRELAENGWVARLALADTVGAAWALAHYGDCGLRIVDCGLKESAILLGALPIAALRLGADTITLLATLGIDRIAQLEALPRSSLPARFGDQVLRRLDQAFGRVAEPIEPHRFLPDIRAVWSLEYPVERLEVLHQIVDRLAGQIHEGLRDRDQGARQVECWLYHEANPPQRLEVGLSRPNQSDRYLAELLRSRLEQTRLTNPVSGMSLRVLVAETLRHEQADLFDMEQAQRQKELAGLIDRLSGRLGRDSVARAVLVPDPQPEYACRFESWLQPLCRKDEPKSLGEFRPLRLWPPVLIQVISVVPDGPPLRFTWSHVDYVITRSWGPERIEAGWWRGQDVQRDYYMVATQLGNRFWIFRRLDDGRWFLHGSFC